MFKLVVAGEVGVVCWPLEDDLYSCQGLQFPFGIGSIMANRTNDCVSTHLKIQGNLKFKDHYGLDYQLIERPLLSQAGAQGSDKSTVLIQRHRC